MIKDGVNWFVPFQCVLGKLPHARIICDFLLMTIKNPQLGHKISLSPCVCVFVCVCVCVREVVGIGERWGKRDEQFLNQLYMS